MNKFIRHDVSNVGLRERVTPNSQDWKHWFNSRDFPLFSGFLPALNLPTAPVVAENPGIVAVELLQGIEEFLRKKGVHTVGQAPSSQSYSLGRDAATVFAGGKIEQVRRVFPKVLSLIHEALPDSGPDFASNTHQLFENVTAFKQAGKSDTEIVEAMLAA